MAVLALVAWLYLTETLPAWFVVPDTLGPIPTGVLWYGALGGVLISLTGVFEHRNDWDDKYVFWHIARPLVGAAVAVIAVLILQSGILATGADPADREGPQNVFYYVVAFLVGYREETFRGLMKRIADVLFTTQEQGSAPVIVGIEPPQASSGDEVTIRGTGLSGTKVVSFGAQESPAFRVVSDGEIAARVPEGDGVVSVTVVNAKGSATASGGFEIT